MWKAAVAAAAFACGVQSACSPYVFSDDVQTLSAKMGSIDASYQDNIQKIIAERHLANRTLWMHDKPELVTGPGCDFDRSNPARCDLIAKGAPAAIVHATAKSEPIAASQTVPPEDVCETPADNVSAPTTASDKRAPPLQRADLLKALDSYTAALAAITKAQDRADFDNAAAKVSAAVGALAQSAPGPYGAAAGPVAKASSSAVLWLVGQDLDYRRLQQLRNATQTACKPIHELASAFGVALEEQRDARLSGLLVLVARKTQAVNIARARHATDQAYGAAIDDAEAAADAFETVRATDPHATAQALSDAHDKLVVAVRNNDGEPATLVASLQTFAQRANDLATAAAANASVTSPTEKKS
jgi:hypothetical protein